MQDRAFAERGQFIAAMRGVAASVAVVTTDGPAGRHGATVTAFSSVSADPPTVLVCLHAESRIARQVRENARFCVNILPAALPEVADRFAGRDDHRIEDRFSGIDCYAPPGQPPMIDGATAFCCDLDTSLRSGSHLVLLGHVREVLDAGTEPLAYCDGAYRRVLPRELQDMGSRMNG